MYLSLLSDKTPRLSLKAMQNPLWHVVISSVLLYSVVKGAAVLNSPFVSASIIQPQRLINSTSGHYSPFFDAVIGTARGPPVPALSCVEAGVLILGNHLAIPSFTERIQPQGWISLNVAMEVSTQGVPGNSIERRFVMWGIFDALCQMGGGHENFRSALWKLEMRGEVVGYLSIHPADLDAMDHGDSSVLGTGLDLTLPSNSSGTNGSVTSNSNTLEAGRLRVLVNVLVPHRPVDLYGVLLNLLGTIVEAAEKPSSGFIPGLLISNIEGSHIQVLISPRRNLTYKLLIQALTLIPSKLAELRIRETFQADIFLGTVKAGTIQVLPGGS